ncbi:MAG: TetR/AcrR family transcriptional regulator [Thermoleophilia bacterium]|nr:TetR/AcrR family transcriptional regulator [Thermoleophilia bacterium]MDH3724475.1 TetR/AcrR family transcriptional regulator [Thermoleophilia bacterium]
MPPGRPRSFDTELALADAQDLFWRRGYRDTTTRDLESRLGVNQSSLYNAFGSKAELLDAVLERYEHQLEDEVIGPLRGDVAGLASLEGFVERFVDWLVAHGARGCLIARMMGEGGDLGPAVADRLGSYRAELRYVLRDGLRRAARAGEIAGSSVERRADLLLSAVLGVNLGAQGGADGDAIRRMGRSIRTEISSWRIDLSA